MDGQVESFGRDIKKNVYGQRAVLVRMQLSERDELRRRSIEAGMSLQQFCRKLLGLPSRPFIMKANSSPLEREQQRPKANTSRPELRCYPADDPDAAEAERA